VTGQAKDPAVRESIRLAGDHVDSAVVLLAEKVPKQ
jgi:hypothetical protein